MLSGWGGPPLFEKLYGGVPPLACAVIDPFEPDVGLTLSSVSVSAGGSVKVVVAVAVAGGGPAASLTVIVKVPAARPEKLLSAWDGPPLFEKLYGGVPPLACAVIDPSTSRWQVGFTLVSVSDSAVTAVSVTCRSIEQP